MQIERIPEWELGAADEAAIAALLHAAFRIGFDGRSFYQQRHHLRMIARDEGRIVGHIGLTFRAIRMECELVDILGIAEVATDPARRGEGIASRLMEEVLAFAGETRAAFLLLFGDQPLYAATGFEAKDNKLRIADHSDARTGGLVERRGEGLMVRPLGQRVWNDRAEIDLNGCLF